MKTYPFAILSSLLVLTPLLRAEPLTEAEQHLQAREYKPAAAKLADITRGASVWGVRGQILAELWALTTIAVAIGSLIFLQFPLFGANFGAGWPVFLVGLTAATVLLYCFVTVCGLYPTWLATRVQPAIALQYE